MVTTLVGTVRSHFGSTHYSNRPVFPTILHFYLPFLGPGATSIKRNEEKGRVFSGRRNCTGEIASFVSWRFHVPELNKLYYIHPGEQVHRPEISSERSERSDNLPQGILTWGTLIILNPKSTPFSPPRPFSVFPSFFPLVLTYRFLPSFHKSCREMS